MEKTRNFDMKEFQEVVIPSMLTNRTDYYIKGGKAYDTYFKDTTNSKNFELVGNKDFLEYIKEYLTSYSQKLNLFLITTPLIGKDKSNKIQFSYNIDGVNHYFMDVTITESHLEYLVMCGLNYMTLMNFVSDLFLTQNSLLDKVINISWENLSNEFKRYLLVHCDTEGTEIGLFNHSETCKAYIKCLEHDFQIIKNVSNCSDEIHWCEDNIIEEHDCKKQEIRPGIDEANPSCLECNFKSQFATLLGKSKYKRVFITKEGDILIKSPFDKERPKRSMSESEKEMINKENMKMEKQNIKEQEELKLLRSLDLSKEELVKLIQ
jgi:hypothetical protein|uniref:Uncharacterized protein n=1 Tax=viral metagenome TaxID=1070528 RepID=A0A6C0J4A1_9ZZZZ